MKSFFKYLLATILGVMIAGSLLLFISIGIFSSMADEDEFEIKKNSILVLRLEKQISDRADGANPLAGLTGVGNSGTAGLDKIIANIQKAKDDDNIKGIYLQLSTIPAGIATIEEIRNALLDFKKSKKFIVSYAENYTQKSYYLASVADSIYLHPEGEIEWIGLSAEVTFIKGLLQKVGVEPEIIRHGKFKSAVEPFILDKMSAANREQTSVFVGGIWNYLLENISKQRNISVQKLNEYANNLAINSAQLAKEYKMVDGLKFYDQILNLLKKKTGISEKNDLNSVSMSDYEKVVVKKKEEKEFAKDKIAVIYASGEIVMGEGSDKTIGAANLARTIRKARRDESIKAIVFRINSPGGSALASDVIWREVVLAKKAKPVVVSMGDMAASGGYYIACAADSIIANPNTITGSIGVFGILMNAKKLMNEKLGITSETVNTNTYSDLGTYTRPMSNFERSAIQKSVEKIYSTFLSHVSEGRKKAIAEIDSMGQGRVWNGLDAKRLGLVDKFGGLPTAIRTAANMAKLKNYRITSLPYEKETMEKIMEFFQGGKDEAFLQRQLGTSYKYFEILKTVADMDEIQARLPYFIDIK